jgi:hypothetical protein
MLGLATGGALASGSGPIDGVTNAPGEGNCTMCHTTFPLNSGAGGISLGGIDGVYAPGDSYALEITVDDPDAMRWGFQFAILDAADQSVGALSPADANTQVSVGGPFLRTYAKHTFAGSQSGQAGQASWTVNWDSPDVGTGDLTLYVAGNGANNNGFNTGDRIYATSFTLTEGEATAADAPGAFARLLPNYPNPFNPKTTLSFSLAGPAVVELAIFDARGVKVNSLYRGPIAGGEHSFVWDGRDASGAPSASGAYFARLLGTSGDLAQARKMLLVK